MKLIILLTLVFHPCMGIWWWFNTPSSPAHDTPTTTAMSAMFAPFEISTGEEKLLQEAKHYLQNLPMLDQCNLLIMNRLKSSCNTLNEEELSKLGVNLLNCQSAVEGRKVYTCTPSMKLVECTSSMDADTWNSYHIISNRARSICHHVRQQHFRMKTEQTVNSMAQATLENVNMLKTLASGQKLLQDTAEGAVSSISANHDQLVKKQDQFAHQQRSMERSVNNNIRELAKEKRVIAQRHKQVEDYTQMINQQLESLVAEIKSQEDAKKQNEKEILQDLDTVKVKADEVLQKLDKVFVDADSYHDNVEDKQNKTLQDLHEIQKTIAYMSETLTKLYTSFNNQMPWLEALFGGAVDKLTLVTLLVTHVFFFVGAVLASVFMGAPSLTRVVMFLLVPLNYITASKGFESLSYLNMTMLLVLTIPVNYVWNKICEHFYTTPQTQKKKPITHRSSEQFSPLEQRSSDVVDYIPHHSSPMVEKEEVFEREVIEEESFHFAPAQELSSTTLFQEAVIKSLDEPISCEPPVSVGTPIAIRRRLIALSPSLDVTPGGSVRCNANTKSGSQCKNAVVYGSLVCHIHSK